LEQVQAKYKRAQNVRLSLVVATNQNGAGTQLEFVCFGNASEILDGNRNKFH
jgi:hypothetical protein